MSTVRVQCPTCQRPGRVSESSAGKKVKCPGCGGTFAAISSEEPAGAVTESLAIPTAWWRPRWRKEMWGGVGVVVILMLMTCVGVLDHFFRRPILQPTAIQQNTVNAQPTDTRLPATPSLLVEKSQYPPPVTPFKRRTADVWGRRAKDGDFDTCTEAFAALSTLQAEGIPFLLEALDHQKDPLIKEWVMLAINGQLLHADSIGQITPYLDQRYRPSMREFTLRVIQDAGPQKASGAIPKIRKLLTDPNEKVRAKAEETLRILEKKEDLDVTT